MSGGTHICKTVIGADGTTSKYEYEATASFEDVADEVFSRAQRQHYEWFRDSESVLGYKTVSGARHIWTLIEEDRLETKSPITVKASDLANDGLTLEQTYAQVHERVSWDTYGLNLAEVAALRADCTRRKVGAVLMAKDHSIIATGYNGGPPKGKSCLAGECPRGRMSKEELAPDSAYDTGGGTCVALHAEWNVLLRTAWHQFEGSTLYVTDKPCHICQVLISGTHIERVVAPHYEWTRT